MEVEEQFVSHIVQKCLVECEPELKVLERDVTHLAQVTPPFPRIHYDDAVKMINEAAARGELVPGYPDPVPAIEWGDDFGAPHETIIGNHFDLPVFVHRYPTAIKAFYMKPDPNDAKVVLGADLLAPEGYGEIIGGGQRIDDLALLEQRLAEHQLPREAFEWYLDLRRYGSVPHSGFGLGIERTVAWICGLDHIRESIPFPRLLHKMYP